MEEVPMTPFDILLAKKREELEDLYKMKRKKFQQTFSHK